MPHFTSQFQAGGPQLQLHVGVSQPRLQALQQASLPIPPSVFILGLVDTGASTTAIDPGIVKALGLQPTGSMAILTASSGATRVQVNTYDVSIVIPINASIGQNHVVGALQVFECALTVQGIQALIGRDILTNKKGVYFWQYVEGFFSWLFSAKEFWAAVLGAVIGGLLTGWFSLVAQQQASKDQRKRDVDAERRAINGALEAIATEVEVFKVKFLDAFVLTFKEFTPQTPRAHLPKLPPLTQNLPVVFDSNAAVLGRISDAALRCQIVAR